MDDQLLDSNIDKPTTLHNGYAGFWERFGAALLDGILLSVVSVLVMGAFGIGIMEFFEVANSGQNPSEVFGSKYYLVFVINLLINLYYFAQQESSEAQATLGKRAVGLIVTDLNGQRLSFQQASVRFFMKQIFSVIATVGAYFNMPDWVSTISLLVFFGYVIQPFTEKKQAFHDIVAKTLVYKK